MQRYIQILRFTHVYSIIQTRGFTGDPLFLLLTLVVATFAFVSCSNDDDDNQYNSDIVGTWKITEVKTSQSGSYIAWPFKTTYASFKSDGTYYGSGYFGNGSGTWSIKGNTVGNVV